jgi:integrase/recombinase XerD
MTLTQEGDVVSDPQHDTPRGEPVPAPVAQPSQPPLFDVTSRGEYAPRISSVNVLTRDSPLPVARYWFRRYLEQSRHPRNTIASYHYDLARLEEIIGPKAIDRITARDIHRYLDDERAGTSSTRKRRLTSVRSLFKWLTTQVKVLESDPSEVFYPDHIGLKTPRPLFAAEQQAYLDAAIADSTRAGVMVWLMLFLGLSRGEVLQLRRDHIDFTDPAAPVIYVFYDNPRWRGKERKLQADATFAALYDAYIAEYAPQDRLFELLPQSVNKMTDRVALAAGFDPERDITPQTLRDTYAIERAREGADETQLLALLGLADDPRNRMSVRRYIKLAAPPVNAPAP